MSSDGQRAAGDGDDGRRVVGRRGVEVAVLAAVGVAALAGTPATPQASPAITPEQVLGRYVQATLSAHDTAGSRRPGLPAPRRQAIRRWQDQPTDSVQRWHLPPLSADVTGYTDSGTAGRQVTAAADVVVTLTVDDRTPDRVTRPGTFTLVDQDGWKICAAILSN